jgi:acetylornithine deacetylase
MSKQPVDPRLAHEIEMAINDLRPAIVDTLANMVQIASPTGHEGTAQQVMASLMRDHGLDVDDWEPEVSQLLPFAEFLTLGEGFAGRPNVIGRWRGAGGGRSLILNGHIDTVDVGDRTAWDVDPLAGTIADGRLYGRGACDMKAGLVANLFALRALHQAGHSLAGDVIVESTISEEDGGAGALAAVLRGYTADAALIAEPTNMAIVPAHGGSLMFRLHVPGLSAHACVRDEGVSSIEKFAYLHRGLLEFERRRNGEIAHPLYEGLSNKVPINIGTIKGGSWPSSVPEMVVAEGRAGLVPGEDLEAFKSRFAQEVAKLAGHDEWLCDHAPRVEWLAGQFAAADVPVDGPLVETLSAVVQQATSATARIAAVTYGADMRHFIHTGGMPCIMFGAGDVRLAHAPNESIDLEELFTATRVTANFIAAWCGSSRAA